MDESRSLSPYSQIQLPIWIFEIFLHLSPSSISMSYIKESTNWVLCDSCISVSLSHVKVLVCLFQCIYVLMLQEFQEEIAQIKDDVTHVNELASTFNLPDIQLSSRNLERIEDLNTRWSLLQVNTNAHIHILTQM